MKKPAFITGILLIVCSLLGAQDTSPSQQQSSYDRFLSRSGTMMRYRDYVMPELRGTYGLYENRIRVLTAGSETNTFYQITLTGKYSSVTGSIDYDDISEVLKAMESLLQAFTSDVSLKPDYLENKFITKDEVAIGYYISTKGNAWYIVLDRNKSDSTAFFKDGQTIKTALEEAKKRMEALNK
jgi:hypothetical protein